MGQTIDSPVQAAAKLAEGLGHEGILQREQAGIKLNKALDDPCAGSVLAMTHLDVPVVCHDVSHAFYIHIIAVQLHFVLHCAVQHTRWDSVGCNHVPCDI